MKHTTGTPHHILIKFGEQFPDIESKNTNSYELIAKANYAILVMSNYLVKSLLELFSSPTLTGNTNYQSNDHRK